jgi:hypothetical protein
MTKVGKTGVCPMREGVCSCVCVSPIHMNTCEYMQRPRSAQVMVRVRVTVTVKATVTVTVIMMVSESESKAHENGILCETLLRVGKQCH